MGQPSRSQTLTEVSTLFGKLGLLGFGGPIAVMGMMEEEACRKRAWVTPAQFAEIYAVCKILPGPVATQMAIYLGSIRGGLSGGLVAGVSFILPSFLIVLVLSVFYVQASAIPAVGPALVGLQASALTVILLSTWQLYKPHRRDLRAWVIVMLTGAVVAIRPSWEPLLILGFGISGAFIFRKMSGARAAAIAAPLALVSAHAQAAALTMPPTSLLLQLFWTFFKAGAFVFGTGLAIVPVLEGDVVLKYHWLTHAQFMDGLAIGQVTPGPVVITSTFIGYQTAGLIGALVATFGIFFPAFVNVLFLVPRIWKKFSGTPAAKGFTAFALPAVVGGIVGTTLKLSVIVLDSPIPLGIFCASFFAALAFSPPAWLLIPLSGVVAGVVGTFFSS